MTEVKLKINGQEDRRAIVSILADNGYEVKIEKEKISFAPNYYVVIKI